MPEPTPGELLIATLTPPNATIIARLAKSVTAYGDDGINLNNIVECDFPGYAPIVLIDWEDVDPGSVDGVQVLSAVIQFQPLNLITPQAAVAFYLTISAGSPQETGLYKIELFDNTFVFDADNVVLERQVREVEYFNA